MTTDYDPIAEQYKRCKLQPWRAHVNFGPVFDLAAAACFLNCAHDRAELDAMCNGIARCLKPGGCFVTVNSNPTGCFSSRLPTANVDSRHISPVADDIFDPQRLLRLAVARQLDHLWRQVQAGYFCAPRFARGIRV